MLLLLESIQTPDATVYRDSDNPLKFYVLPEDPTMRMENGRPVFKYLIYRTLKPLPNGGNGAALVFMDIELALNETQMAALAVLLAEKVTLERGPGAQPVDPKAIILSKPEFTAGSVTVDMLGGSGNLVQRVNHAGKPSMYGNNIVAISAELTEFGAAIFEAAMKTISAGGVRVTYDLSFAARLPEVRATGHWTASKFYSFVQQVDFEENFWSEDDFTESVDEIFVNSESRVVDIDPGVLPSDHPVLNTIRGLMTQHLDDAIKRNLIEAIPPENRDFSKVRDADFENIKRSVMVNKSSDVFIQFREKQVTTVTKGPQANVKSLAELGLNFKDFSQEVDADHPFLRQLNLTIQVNAEFEVLPIFSVDVTVDFPPHTALHGVRTFTFKKADDVGKFDAFLDGQPKKFKYRYVVNYKGESRTFTSPLIDHEGDDLKINIDDLGLWMVDVEIGDMNFDQVTKAVLTLRHPEIAPGDRPAKTFQIDKNFTKQSVKAVLLQPAQPYGGSLKYFMKDGREFVRELAGLTDKTFIVDDPFSANKTIQVRSRGDFERSIDTIFIDFDYSETGNDFQQTPSVIIDKGNRGVNVTFPVIDEANGKLTFRAITTFRDGRVSDPGPKELTERTLVVGEQANILSVTVLPDLIDWTKVKLATVELTHGAESETFVFRKGEATERTWELALPDGEKKEYRWFAKFFMETGDPITDRSPEPVDDEKLVVELP
ncbi:hypothetical protein AB0K48_21765 [Nonomuraea sp. NPDC055795]